MGLMKELLRYDEAAHIISSSVKHVQRLVDMGKLTRVYLGEGRRGARITRESIDHYIEELKRRNGSLAHPP